MKKNKAIYDDNKKLGIEDLKLVYNTRQLESSTGLSYTIIQRTFAGERDIQFTTMLCIIDGIGISFGEFALLYEKITDQDIEEALNDINEGKRKP